MIKGIGLFPEVGDQYIVVSIIIVIPKSNAHAPLQLAAFTIGSTYHPADFGKSPIAVILIEEVGTRIVGHIDIWISIVVVISANHAETVELLMIHDVCCLGHIREGTIPFIAVQYIRLSLHAAWSEVDFKAFPRVRLLWSSLNEVFKVDVVCNVQVQVSIDVVIKKRTSCAEPFVSHFCNFCHICKSSIPLVAVQDVFPVIGHIDIWISIVVVIPDSATHPPTSVP